MGPEGQRYKQAKQILQGAIQDTEQLRTTLRQMATRAEDPPRTTTENLAASAHEPQRIPPDGAGEYGREEPSIRSDSDRDAVVQETSDPLIAHALLTLDASLKKIEELRRLFFSLVEHLRDTARRQGYLNDDTNQVAGKSEWQTPERIGPLANRQQQLQDVAAQLSQAWHQQAQQTEQATNHATAPSTPSSGHPDPAATAALLQQAGDLVGEATSAMQKATVGFSDASAGEEANEIEFDRIGEYQRTAFEKLLEALALLDDPQDQNQQGNQQQQQPPQDQKDEQQQQQQQQQNLNVNQLLQLIRDREAQRRRDRQRDAGASTGTVEKDW